jgi:hypothetical protein
MIENRQQSAAAFEFLRQFARRRPALERCEMCSTPLAPDHQHLLEPVNRKIACACDACAILFHAQGDTKFKRIPRRIRFLPDFQLTESQWNGMLMPINMAFFFKSTPHEGRVIACIPVPPERRNPCLRLTLGTKSPRIIRS